MGIFASTGNIVAQSSDPGSLGAGSIWSDTDSQVTYRRTDDNAQWVPIGNKVGDILFWGGTEANAPTGFAICDGTAISRTDFALLFDVIGTTFGIGDGSTTFNLPDLQTANRFPRAATNDAGVGDTGGAATHALSIAELATHTHTQDSHTHADAHTTATSGTGVTPLTALAGDNQTQLVAATTAVNQNTGSGTAHNNEPQFIDFHYIISTGL